MSRDAFGEESLLDDLARQSYSAREKGLEREIAREIVKEYNDVDYPSDLLSRSGYLRMMLLEVEDGQMLIDETIRAMRETSTRVYYHLADASIMVPIIALLQEKGQHQFIVDYGENRPFDVWRVGEGLRSTPDQPLHVSYSFDVMGGMGVSLGWSATDCRISALGKVQSVGESAKSSSFLLSHPPKFLGKNGSNDCVYHLEGVESVDNWQVCEGSIARMEYLNPYKKDKRPYDHLGRDAHITGNFDPKTIMLHYYFEDDGNKLLIPGANGGWQEVRP